MNSYFYKICDFDGLTNRELYEVFRLRSEVFVVEQNCPYLDLDRRDFEATHVLQFASAASGAPLVGYTRLFGGSVYFDGFSSIGRVVTSPSVRGTGAGKALMQKSIDLTFNMFPDVDIKIGAQSYLLRFYSELGFVSTEEEFLEDDIPHTYMIFPSKIGGDTGGYAF
ncbi:MAG: hypothetical protein RL757_1478 [Bacteroidota bacterium]|jgi:ElaA protein